MCLIGGGKYSGKKYLLRALINLVESDLVRHLSNYDICVKLIGLCHNRLVDLLQDYSPIRLLNSINGTFLPNDEYHLQNARDINYICNQIKKRRRFLHQFIEFNFRPKSQSNIIGSVMIAMLASSQYMYTRNLCSDRRKFLMNSLNRTLFFFRRALSSIKKNPRRARSGKTDQ